MASIFWLTSRVTVQAPESTSIGSTEPRQAHLCVQAGRGLAVLHRAPANVRPRRILLGKPGLHGRADLVLRGDQALRAHLLLRLKHLDGGRP